MTAHTPRADQTEIRGRVEQARIPALPRRQQRLDLLAQAQTLWYVGIVLMAYGFTTDLDALNP